MRLLLFHGYLLRGTGSNVYNASLAEALVALGHEVHLLSQDRDPARLPFVDAVGSWEEGRLTVEPLHDQVRCTAYRPDIGGLLPVYVADRYDGIEARPFPDLSGDEIDHYVAVNVTAVQDVVGLAVPDLALANHLVMGPAILARALADHDVPYVVKIHGSALEYTVKPHPRFLPWAREGIAGARAVLVGSRHVARSLMAALHDPELPARTRLGPPGVDVERFQPLPPAEARRGLERLERDLRELAASGRGGSGEREDSAFARDEGAAADALRVLREDREAPLVAFVGKFLAAKGLDLLLAAWPLVLQDVPAARLVLVGFGSFEGAARELLGALAGGDLAGVRELAADLKHLRAFLDTLGGPGAGSYFEAAARLPEQTTWLGRLEHDELAALLPACEAQVVPSTFPEAFGMVAAEAAACGVLPVSADHSGLAEVSAALAEAVPAEARALLSFPIGPRAVPDLAERLVAWLSAPAELRRETRGALVKTARERYSWRGVARGVIVAGTGDLGDLPPAA